MGWLNPSYRLAALAFVVSVVYWPTIFSAPFMPRWWAIAIGLPLLCDIVPRRIDRVLSALLILGFSWTALQFTFIDDPFNAILPFYFLALIGLGFVAASNVRDLDPVLYAMSLGTGISSTIIAAQYFDLPVPIPVLADPGGLFFNSEVLAELAAPLFIWALVGRRWALVALLVIPLILCQSRIAVMGVALGLLYAYGPRSFPQKALWASMALFVVFVAMTIIGGKLGSFEHRLTLWATGLYSISLFGNGLGWWASAHPFGFEEFVHSDLLQFLVELGIGGLFFIAIPVLILLRGIANKALGASFAVLCLECLVSFPLHVPATALLFACMAGFLAGDWRGFCVSEREGGTDGGAFVQWPESHNPAVARRSAEFGRILWD